MKGARVFELGEIAEFINGGAWSQDEYAEQGVPVVRVSDIHDYTVDFGNCKYLSVTSSKKYQKNKLMAGDLVICTVGSHPTQPNSVVGRPGIMPAEATGALLNQNAVCIRPSSDLLDKNWLGYFARSNIMKDFIISQARGSASQVRVAISAIKSIKIPLPSIGRQIEVAEILSAYDSLIENNNRRIAILENMAQSLYREWFVNFRFPGYENCKFVDSVLGKVPEGWGVVTINSIIDIKSGFAFKSNTFVENGQYQLVTIKNVKDGQFVSDSDSKIRDLPHKLPDYCKLSEGDILLSLTGNVGRVCLVYGEDFLLNQRVAKLVPINSKHHGVSYFMFRQPEMQKRLEMLANGVAQQNLSPIQTGGMDIIFPTNGNVLSLYADFSQSCVNEMLCLWKRNKNLKEQRNILLPRLVGGQVELDKQ